MDDTAVLDAVGEVDAVVEHSETPSDPGVYPGREGEETESREPGSEDQPAGEAGKEPASQTAVVDGKRLSEAAKATLAEIKAKNPALAAQIRAALFESDALRRELPGGLKEYRELRQQLEEAGGFDAIGALKTEASEWRALDEQFTSANPEFVTNISEANPNAFVSLAPSVIAKFREMAPEAYSKHVGSVMLADMMQENIPLLLERLGDFLPQDNARALECLQRIQNYVRRIDGFARQDVKSPQIQAKGAPDERETKLAERESTLRKQEWGQAINGERMRVYNGEWNRLSAGRSVSDQKAGAIREVYLSKLEKLANADPQFRKNIDRYFTNNDQKGYERYMASVYQRFIPAALKFAFDNMLPAKPGPKPTPATQNQAAPRSGNSLGKAPDDFRLVAKSPDAREFRYGRNGTTPDMIRQGKGILLDGRKVRWANG